MMNKRLKNRLWLVTCLALAIITTYTIYRYYCVHRIGDSDFYWHIMLGKNAISGLSADDSLVWPNSIYQTSYTNYSLLSDIILYKLSCIREDETFGALVYMLITAFITSFIVFAGWGRNVIKKISSSARSTITSISAILFSVWLLYMAKGNPRPHLMALACFVVSIGILESRKPNVSYLAIPLAVIWANLHGASMPLLIVMELLYLIVSLPIFRKLNVEVVSYAINEYTCRILSVALSFLAGLCNPVGIKIYTRLFHVSNNANILAIKEWSPATITSSVGVVLLLVFLVTWALSPSKRSIAHIIPVIVAGMLMLLHVRFESWFFAALAIYVLDAVGKCEANYAETTSRSQIIVSVFSAAVALFCTVNMATNQIHSLCPLRYPSEAVINAIKDYAPKRMYTDINTGAFFEYNGIPVIIDSRIDMYDKELLQDMNAIKGKVSVTDGTPDYTEAVLEKYNIDMVTLCRGDSMMLIGYMSQKQNWRITYQDSAYVIFQKTQE